jgi:hypothetical protein
VVKHVDAAELRVVVAEVLAVGVKAVLVAHHLPNLVLIWLPHWPACVCKVPREEVAWRRGARGRKGRERAEIRKKLRLVIWHGKQEMPVKRTRVSRTGI